MQDIELLNRDVYGATLLEWITASATLVLVLVGLLALRYVVVRRLTAVAARTATQADDLALDIVRRTRPYFLFLVAFYAAARVVPMPAAATGILDTLFVVIVLLQIGRWGNGVIGFLVERHLRRRSTEDVGARTTIQAVGYGGRFLLWMLLLITGLQNFGINVTALVTGLGIGGVAIALAVQSILGDLFAALAIVLDKPFVVGEFIHVDTIMGTVEHVGLKTTRIRSLSGEQIIISNADLLRSRIRNYKRMQERRVLFHLDLTYDTPPETIAGVPGIIRSIIESQQLTRVDRCHFLAFAESALRIETVYYVLTGDFNVYADIQHTINLEILRRFAAEGINFAFPSRTVYVQGSSPSPTDSQLAPT